MNKQSSVQNLDYKVLGREGLKGRSEQATNDLECSAQVLVFYLRCSGKLFKVLWLVNYLFYKDYFGSNEKGGRNSNTNLKLSY